MSAPISRFNRFRIRLYRAYAARLQGRKRDPSFSTDPIDLEAELARFQTAIFYAGLRSIRADSADDAFDRILSVSRNVPVVAIPGFTPSFRQSGLFAKKFSRPEVGAFSRIAFERSFNRSDDPVHSLFLLGNDKGEIDEIQSATGNDTFAETGVYRYLCGKDSCIVNVGTKEPRLGYHFVERLADVPYMRLDMLRGVLIDNDMSFRNIEHYSYRYKIPVRWNRIKIVRLLLREGCMRVGQWEGAHCRIIDVRKAKTVLLSKLSVDPYFLVTC